MKLYFHAVGNGHPFVILHGLFGSSDNWFTLSNFFAQKFKVYAVDLRNHGRSSHSNSFDYWSMAEDLNDLLIHESVRSVFLLGHSMGGKTAMQFSLMHQEKVDKLVVVDIAPKAYPPKHDEIFDALLALKLEQYKTRSELDSALSQRINDHSVRQLILKNVFRDDQGKFRWRINVDALYKNYHKINEAIGSTQKFPKPALFVRGGNSSYILDEDILQIKSIFPAAELVTIEGVGHWVHAEAPQKFAEVVMEFLIR
jgi:esterase